MDPRRLERDLTRSQAYPHPVGPVRVAHTHISMVFLAGDYAYKIKKPRALGFLDFTTLAARRHFCAEEVRLNRRLAPGVYLGVVSVVEEAGALRIVLDPDAPGTVEYAVRMRRLPEERTFRRLMEADALAPATVAAFATHLAAFHLAAESGPAVDRYGRFDVVARNVEENFAQLAPWVGRGIRGPVLTKLRRLTLGVLAAKRDLIEDRAARHCPRDTHGDLHLSHVYSLPGEPPGADLVAIDCIEFNTRFRYADPVSDVAFLAMDLEYRGRRDLAAAFVNAYFQAARDPDGRELVALYEAYRATVRSKVACLRLQEEGVGQAERGAARREAEAHLLLAIGFLERPGRRPCMLLVGGLPGSGKSTVARGLAAAADLTLISTDRVRKGLAGIGRGDVGGDWLYTADWDDRTYGACLERAAEVVSSGGRVVVDGTFRSESRRRAFLDRATTLGVPARLLVATAPEATIRRRLAARPPGWSDADEGVYDLVAARWEAPGHDTARDTIAVDTAPPEAEVLRWALAALVREGLASPEAAPRGSRRGGRSPAAKAPGR